MPEPKYERHQINAPEASAETLRDPKLLRILFCSVLAVSRDRIFRNAKKRQESLLESPLAASPHNFRHEVTIKVPPPIALASTFSTRLVGNTLSNANRDVQATISSTMPKGQRSFLRPRNHVSLANQNHRSFLSQYLKRGGQEVEALIKEIELRFPDLPGIPLMLKLVAAVYDKKG